MPETPDVYWIKSFLQKNPISCTMFVNLLDGDPKEKIPGVVGLFYEFFDRELKEIIEATLSAEQWIEAGALAQRAGVNQDSEFWKHVEEALQHQGKHLHLVANNS